MSPKDIASALFPPGIPAIARWRLVIFASVAVLMFHVAWACGWLGYIGLGNGFAYAEDVQKVQTDITSLRQSIIEQTMFDMQIRRCAAPQGGELRRFLTEKIQRLQNEYRDITGIVYQLPSCEEM